MTQKSFLWTTGGAGDGASTYTRSEWKKIFEILASCMYKEGVALNYRSSFSGSVPGANTFRVAPGGAIVDGKPLDSDANEDITIPSAVGGGNTRIDRIVLRADWTAQTVRVTRIAGTDAATPSAPTISSTSESVYDLLMYQVLVNTAGTVTLREDERILSVLQADTIEAGMIADGAIDSAALIVDETITAAKIANRTRRVLVPGLMTVYDYTDPNVQLALGSGLYMADGADLDIYGYFAIPNDCAGSVVVKVVVVPQSNSGNIYALLSVDYGASGENYNNHTGSVSVGAVAVTGNKYNVIFSLSLSSAAAGDFLLMAFSRQGSNVSDTLNQALGFVGFLVEYTADS